MLALLTLFEPVFLGMPAEMEKTISALLLVLPPVIGVILAGMSLIRRQAKAWMAVAGILLNSVFAIFHLFVLSFAG